MASAEQMQQLHTEMIAELQKQKTEFQKSIFELHASYEQQRTELRQQLLQAQAQAKPTSTTTTTEHTEREPPKLYRNKDLMKEKFDGNEKDKSDKTKFQ